MPVRRAALVIASVIAIAATLPASAGGPVRPGQRAADAGTPQPPIALAASADVVFGEVQIGTTSAAAEASFTNTSAAPQTLTLGISGEAAADFAIAIETCTGSSLAPGGSCSVAVTFTPSAEYERQASLDFDNGSGLTSVVLAGTGVLPASGVTWAGTGVVGSAYRWTQGGALATSSRYGVTLVHAVVVRYDTATERVVYHRRATSGTRWEAVLRLSPRSQHASRAAVAAAGTRVYVAWSSFASSSPRATQPRVLYLRKAGSHGAGTWSSPRRLTALTGRIDYPRLAASGSHVYVAYTNASTGAVMLKVSHDRGATWGTVRLGTVTRKDGMGYAGRPTVAASGSTVSVAWIRDAAGDVVVRTSTTAARSWSAPVTLGSGARAGSAPTIAMLGARTAVAWTTDDEMALRVGTGSTWGPERLVGPSAGAERPYLWTWTGAIALHGSSQVGVAFEACWAACGPDDPTADYRSDVVWRESGNNGATWAKSQAVVPSDESEYEAADLPSVAWPAGGSRYLMASRWYGPNLLYNVPFRIGTGTP